MTYDKRHQTSPGFPRIDEYLSSVIGMWGIFMEDEIDARTVLYLSDPIIRSEITNEVTRSRSDQLFSWRDRLIALCQADLDKDAEADAFIEMTLICRL